MPKFLVDALPSFSHLPLSTQFFGPVVVFSALLFLLCRAREFAVLGFSASIYALTPFMVYCHL